MAVIARVRPVASPARERVIPLVTTSSTSTAPAGTTAIRLKAGVPRRFPAAPARRRTHTAAPSAPTTGTPAIRPTRRASSHAGSTPYDHLRAATRGTGTSAVQSDPSNAAMASANGAAAAARAEYLR